MFSRSTLTVATPTERDIVITRLFHAPRRMVWDAMTRPVLLKRWLYGPPGWTMTVCEGEPRVGDEFRWAWRGPDGAELVMRGVHREVVPPARIVRTELFEGGCNSHPCEQLGTLELSEHDDGGDRGSGRTTLTFSVRYPSAQARDAALSSGMQQRIAAGYERLEALLAASPAAGACTDAA
jgi:uncharacterized protein YndB with AHSA1/START domain